MDLRRVVEEADTPAGRRFDNLVTALIVASLITFSIETLPDLPPVVLLVLQWVDVATVVLFTLEYFLRVGVAENRWRFVRSFFGVVDLLAILPFYLSLGAVDLRSLRAFRLLRLFRILKLYRYARVVRRLRRAAAIAREELFLFLTVALILIFLSAVGVYHFEHESQPEAFASIFHSLWWAVVTLTGVGYGDVYPITLGGRTFTFFVLLIGLGLIAVPTGLFASALVQARDEQEEEERKAAEERGE